MIRFLRRIEIDNLKWDNCVQKSPAGHLYACSWHLDSIAGNWSGLVQNDYEAVMPLPERRKFGVNYIYQPIFSQQLGIYSPSQILQGQLSEFIQSLPRTYKFVETNLNFTNCVSTDGHEITPRINYELELRSSYAAIEKGYSSNTRRNIKKAINEITLSDTIDIGELLSLKRSVDTFRRSDSHYLRIERYMLAVMQKSGGEIIGARVKEHLVAAAFFAHFGKRIYYFIPASNAEGKNLSAMYGIIDHVIRKNASSHLILDFEGSVIPGIARFFRGFGAAGINYCNLRINRLPWPVKWIKG
jgi:hypothetical protein